MSKDPFKELADWQRDLESAEARFEKFKGRKCDWDDPEDVNQYRRGRRADERRIRLDKLVPDRKCPRCGLTVLQNRSWVFSKRKKNLVICRSCYHRLMEIKLDKEGELSRIRLKKAMARAKGSDRFILSGVSLETAIQLAGMSKAHFSRRAGWSAPYTQKLVAGKVKSVNADTAKVILMVLAEGGVEYELEKTDYETIFGVEKRRSG